MYFFTVNSNASDVDIKQKLSEAHMVEASGSRLSQDGDDQEVASGKSTPHVSSSKYFVAWKYFYSSCRKMWQKCLKTLLTQSFMKSTCT